MLVGIKSYVFRRVCISKVMTQRNLYSIENIPDDLIKYCILQKLCRHALLCVYLPMFNMQIIIIVMLQSTLKILKYCT